MARRILIVGSWNTTHIRRFISILCKNNQSDLIIDSFDPRFDDNQGNECGVNKVFRISSSSMMRRIYGIRKIGTFFKIRAELNTFEDILLKNQYDLVNIHFLPQYSEAYVKIAHKNNVKVMLTPLGSDVLRVGKLYLPSLRRAFNKTDYVSANFITGFCSQVKEMFKVPYLKMIDLGYGSEIISSIVENKGKRGKQELAACLDIPISNYYITCGYNASIAQRHHIIIEAIIANKDNLPSDSIILVPLTYGADKETIKQSISSQIEGTGLKVVFLTSYMTIEQVCALRLITDMFIHIQTTDAYNASLQEFILADTVCINGSWLRYPSLQKYGNPYYECKFLDDLPQLLNDILLAKVSPITIHYSVLDEIISNSWSNRIKGWIVFYNELDNSTIK